MAVEIKGQKHPGPVQLRPFTFYLGRFIALLGSSFFFVGVSSKHWVSLNMGQDEVSADRRLTRVSHWGPWTACRHDGYCHNVWRVVPGIDAYSTEGTQAVFILSMCFHLVALASMFMQVFLPKPVQKRMCAFKEQAVVELFFSLGVVSGFLAMLLMGQLKKMSIRYGNQEEAAGSGFFITLVSVVLTITGVICMLLNRYAASHSKAARYVHRIKKWSKRRKQISVGAPRQNAQPTSGGQVTSVSMDAIDVSRQHLPWQQPEVLRKTDPHCEIVMETPGSTAEGSLGTGPFPDKRSDNSPMIRVPENQTALTLNRPQTLCPSTLSDTGASGDQENRKQPPITAEPIPVTSV